MISVPKAPCIKATTYLYSSALTPVRPIIASQKSQKVLADKNVQQPTVLDRSSSRRLPFAKAAPTASWSFGGPGQVRTMTTLPADIVPDYSGVRRKMNQNPTQKNEAAVSARVFTYMTAGAAAVPGIYAGKTLVQTIVGSFSTTKDVLALAKLEVKLTDIPEGKSLMVKWRGKPVYVRHRTPQEIETEQGVDLGELRDQQHDTDRTLKPDWLVVIGICTHLGCVPVADAGQYGGFYCPCHGSHYDTSGRIRKGPAPLNLEVPDYTFPDEETLVVG